MKKKLFSIVTFCLGVINFGIVNAAMFYEKDINSDSVYIVNKHSGMSIVEKNINKRRSPASLTKIMTFIVAYEHAKNIDKTKIKVNQNVLDKVDTESSGVKLNEGEELTLLDLFHCMLISSSGYAAMVIADYIGGGSIESFADMMNEKAISLGCSETHFMNPDGIYNQEQYSTAQDIYKITKCAMDIPGFLSIVSKSEYNLFGDERDPVITTNKMIDNKRGGEYYSSYVKGIKTGYLEEAGRCLVSYAVKDNDSYIGVVMGGTTTDEHGDNIERNMAMIDTKNIYDWAFENLKTIKLYPREFPVSEIKLGLVWKRDKLLLAPESDFYAALPVGFKKEDITIKANIPESVDAPVNKGEIIGTCDVFYRNQKIGSFNAVSIESFGKNYLLIIGNILGRIFCSPIFIIISSLFIILLGLYILMMFRAYKKRRRSRIKRFPTKGK